MFLWEEPDLLEFIQSCCSLITTLESLCQNVRTRPIWVPVLGDCYGMFAFNGSVVQQNFPPKSGPPPTPPIATPLSLSPHRFLFIPVCELSACVCSVEGIPRPLRKQQLPTSAIHHSASRDPKLISFRKVSLHLLLALHWLSASSFPPLPLWTTADVFPQSGSSVTWWAWKNSGPV